MITTNLTTEGIYQIVFSFPSSGLGMPTLKLCLAFGVYKRKNKLILLAVTPSGAW